MTRPYLVRHGAGYSIFEHHSQGLKQQMRAFAPIDAPLKIVSLRLENCSERVRRITATYYAEWVLGVNRDEMQQYVVPAYDDGTAATAGAQCLQRRIRRTRRLPRG